MATIGINELLTGRAFTKPTIVKVFDNYEISGCRKYLGDEDGFIEPVENDDEAEFWTLYGHTEGEGVVAIGDFATREAAEEIYLRIVGECFTGSYKPNPAVVLRNAASALADSLQDVLSRFSSCIADGNGEIEGDRDAIETAQALLRLRR